MLQLWHKRFTIQKPTKTRDVMGGERIVWQDLPLSPRLYGSLKVLAGAENYQSGQNISARTVEIQTHYRTDLRTSMRLKLKERIFQIIAITDRTGHKKNLEILAIEERPEFTAPEG